MKLDVSAMRYLTKEHFRVLTAIEMGMKNHEVVPVELITSIAKLRHGGIQKVLSHLLRNRLISHDGKSYDGYRLTYSGYDYLALQVFLQRGQITGLGRQIGIGKESDIYLATQEDGTEVAIKFHRLGRTSFRAVKNKRDYVKNKSSGISWFYMSRLSAMKEYAFLKALFDRDFPTPTPIDHNRHAICMSLVDGYPLNQVRRLANSKEAYDTSMSILVRLAECGLVHCDFNEFNLMISEKGVITIIDFPQMISTSHPNASELFDRDVNGLVKFFSRLQGGAYTPDIIPKLQDISVSESRVDVEVEASGFGGEYDEHIHELSIYSAHGEDREIGQHDEKENFKVLSEEDLTGNVCSDEDNDEIHSAVASSVTIHDKNEYVKQHVLKDIARKKSTIRRKSRNQSKLSVKGKLVHKEHW